MVSHCCFPFAFLRLLVLLSLFSHVLLAIWVFCDLLVPILGPFFIGLLPFSHWFMVIFIFWILMACSFIHWKYHFLVCGLFFSFVYGIFFCVGLFNVKVVSFLSSFSFMVYVFLYLQEILLLPQGHNDTVLFHI